MGEIVLYSTGCPKCKILKSKLDAKNIKYIENNDMETMLALGIDTVPVLYVNEVRYEFAQAVKWINEK